MASCVLILRIDDNLRDNSQCSMSRYLVSLTNLQMFALPFDCVHCQVGCLYRHLGCLHCHVECLHCHEGCLHCLVECLYHHVGCLHCYVGCLYRHVGCLHCLVECLYYHIGCLDCQGHFPYVIFSNSFPKGKLKY